MTEHRDESDKPDKSGVVLEHVVSPLITAILGLIAGLLLAKYNSDTALDRFFLEKRAKTADDIATEFSKYIDNWDRLMRLRKNFDSRKDEPSPEERENFKKVVFARSDSRDKLFSAIDSTYLYYSNDISDIIFRFEEWDRQQSTLTIEKLPPIEEWKNWQIKILRKIQEEIRK